MPPSPQNIQDDKSIGTSLIVLAVLILAIGIFNQMVLVPLSPTDGTLMSVTLGTIALGALYVGINTIRGAYQVSDSNRTESEEFQPGNISLDTIPSQEKEINISSKANIPTQENFLNTSASNGKESVSTLGPRR